MRYTDPSGHETCTDDGYCGKIGDKQYWHSVSKSFESEYGISFNKKWSQKDKISAMIAVMIVGDKFAETLENGSSASEAFKEVYGLQDGDTFFFEWDTNCWGCREDPPGCDLGTTTGDACVRGFGYTNSENWIEFASMSTVEVPLRNINNVIHELGHAFNIRLGRGPENALAVRQDLLVNGAGFFGYPNNRTWEASSGMNGTETFADQFLGWVYGKWGADPLGVVRAEFMTGMNGENGWVVQAGGRP